ncbi:solute carrier family 25 member 35-like isoform X2 [Wyeomyia smithii]|uniref:solute carrier family 25 member 35-like isoform X2 n=1 Tax=Wyeomyia smithii TaxID=174621 RepID=UPI002467AF7D|nr:solute carrier family 25 member 35-like isoform X2 [Wyeomyia smithii]
MDGTDFLLGGIASMGATLVTNPLEVVKTRMQLQGELAVKGSYAKPYKSVVDAFITFGINSVRLGVYNTAYENGLTKAKNGNQSLWKCAFWGGLGGFIGSAISSPFFMLRTHLQSQAAAQIAVGYQHKHTSMFGALREIFGAHGLKGLYRGVSVTLPRAMLGSGGQLAGFGYTRDLLTGHRRYSLKSERLVSFISGIVAGTVMAITMTPPDVVATRLYNQGVDVNGKGIYYTGVFDCCVKIIKTEGIAGLYKGFWPHYMRIGPHSMLVLFFFDELKKIRKSYYQKKQTKL